MRDWQSYIVLERLLKIDEEFPNELAVLRANILQLEYDVLYSRYVLHVYYEELEEIVKYLR